MRRKVTVDWLIERIESGQLDKKQLVPTPFWSKSMVNFHKRYTAGQYAKAMEVRSFTNGKART